MRERTLIQNNVAQLRNGHWKYCKHGEEEKLRHNCPRLEKEGREEEGGQAREWMLFKGSKENSIRVKKAAIKIM